MKRKEMAEKILKMFNIDLPVEYDGGYAIVYDRETNENIRMEVEAYEVLPLNETENKVFLAFIKQHKDMRLGISYHLFAMLHEIGHLMNEGSFDHDEHECDCDSLSDLFRAGEITENRYAELYNLIEAESLANEWAIEWVNNNKQLALALDKELD